MKIETHCLYLQSMELNDNTENYRLLSMKDFEERSLEYFNELNQQLRESLTISNPSKIKMSRTQWCSLYR